MILSIDDSSNFSNPYYFTGQRLDEETSNYYYKARYYSWRIGRFLSVDPIGYYDSMNLYQYCGNNPINYIDPWGLWGDDGHSVFGRNPGRFNYTKLDNNFFTSPLIL